MIDKKLLKLLGKDKKQIFFIVFENIFRLLLNTFVTGMFTLIFYFLFLKNNNYLNYLLPSLGIIVALLLKIILHISTGNRKGIIAIFVKKDLRSKMYKKLTKLGTRSTNGINMSGLTQVSIEGIEQLDIYYSQYLPLFFSSMISPIILFAIIAPINYQTALVLLAGVPLIPGSIMLVSRFAKKIFSKYWNKYISMGDTFFDNMQGMLELKLYKADKYAKEDMNKKAEDFRKITMKVLVMQLWSLTIMDTVAFGGAGIAIVVALSTLFKGQTLGPEIYAKAVFLILVASEYFIPLRQLGSAFHIAMNGLTAGKKIVNILNQEEPVFGKENLTEVKNISIKNLEFSYNEDKKILDNINIEFEKGLNAIVGESGSGKSTIISLLIRKYSDYKGSIKINNKEISSFTESSLYSKLALVKTDTYLFSTSIKNNFKIAGITNEDDMLEALKKVKLDNRFKTKDDLNYLLQEDSTNISGGERQRISLAIHLVDKKDIYLFDECTSNIDIESEEIIMNQIKELSKNSIVILISHRLDNVKNADCIYYLENSKIKEKGKHNDLINLKGTYYNVYKTQENLKSINKEIVL